MLPLTMLALDVCWSTYYKDLGLIFAVQLRSVLMIIFANFPNSSQLVLLLDAESAGFVSPAGCCFFYEILIFF